MVEIAKLGAALLAEIGSTYPPHGELAFWWLGQNGVVLRGGGATVCIDLYMADNDARRTPPAWTPDSPSGASLILGTHDHGDHIDREALPAMMAANPAVKLLVSRVAARDLKAAGYPPERLIGLDDGETFEADGVAVTGMRAAHEFFDRDGDLGYPYLAFLVSMNGVSVYHAGDGVPWEGMVSAVRDLAPDAMFVPINGRDAERYRRNCIGNFTFQEAVDFVGAVEPGLAVPMHYDMFVGNQERVERFTDYLGAKYPAQAWWAGAVGEQVRVRGARRRV